ncbi:CRISPR system precrRNA processing endoribonuclease RAMP protein Cas6 [Methanosphaerula palustris]|uniref:CRISPR-associated Cas5e family protein n=1 Tax=Methanosphaerula palustris (strain ATCC BAA-1556 / DSM 19958 / E1-9c) TaxID=521011 RepID=B8GIG7_METPE|nr:CRISPR system precrRNA processing endoribonuclease RAMP protein Cas6 [Methanosphaerula palustris]ACL15518.1 CRISPR-associated Cas5e family protein [Methanosphaerula palustris E1-9c]
MRRLDLILVADEPFEIPLHEGYQLYSALLGLMKGSSPNVSQRVHDSPISSFSLGGFKGPFQQTDSANRKRVIPNQPYHLRIGITDPRDEEILHHLAMPFILGHRVLSLDQGDFNVVHIEDQSVSIDDWVHQNRNYTRPLLEFNFETVTCIQYRNSTVTEMYPNRIAVFNSILSKWNRVFPNENRLDASRDDFGRYLVERPNFFNLATYSVLTNTVTDQKKRLNKPIFKQGFVGPCRYSFTTNTPEWFRTTILLLSRFAEYSGVGSGVARGYGQVKVTVQGGANEE